MNVVESVESLHLDALLVLGRGVDDEGRLHESSRVRTEAAVELAQVLMPRVVAFSGGRSWRQAVVGVKPPSEGGQMLGYAYELMQGSPPDGVTFCAEEESESTIANMVLGAPLLKLRSTDCLGLLSDELHFLHERPQFSARKVFPNTSIQPLTIPRPYTASEAAEEKRTTLATKLILTGVRSGNLGAIMRRQRALERVNRLLRG